VSASDLNQISTKEVTLPLREVLALVTIVANLENENDDSLSLDDNSMYSTIHSMVSMDTKLPKLREAFMNLQAKNHRDSNPSTRPIEYKPVTNIETKAKMKNRRGSAVNAFLEGQTRREYVIVGQENDHIKSDPITSKMVTEEMEVPDLGDYEEDTFQV